MAEYSNRDMIFTHSRANVYGREVARMYQFTVPPQTIDRGNSESARTVDPEEHILQFVEPRT